MAKGRISKKQYDAMVKAFREKPGIFGFASRSAGVHHKTAKRAWEVGWDTLAFARPIHEIIEEDMRAARADAAKALLAEAQSRSSVVAAEADEKIREVEERKLAKRDAAAERAREAVGAQSAMSSALTVLTNLGQFSKASIAMSKKAAQDLAIEVAAGKVTWKEAVEFHKAMSLVGKRAVEQLKGAMEVSRLWLGQPEKILGIVATGMPSTQVDGESAVNHLGEDRFRQAVIDLASGKVTPDVEHLLEWQVDQGTQH